MKVNTELEIEDKDVGRIVQIFRSYERETSCEKRDSTAGLLRHEVKMLMMEAFQMGVKAGKAL